MGEVLVAGMAVSLVTEVMAVGMRSTPIVALEALIVITLRLQATLLGLMISLRTSSMSIPIVILDNSEMLTEEDLPH